jgi:hypothetical protein
MNMKSTTKNSQSPTASKLKRELSLALRYFADLNGCEWIKGSGQGEADMRQRAKAIQSRLVKVLHA